MEPVCPLDFRYGQPEMKKVMSYQARVERCLKAEAALARAHAKVGNIPAEAAEEITEKATLEHVSIERVEEIERDIKHDIMAIVNALTEICGKEAGKYIHFGATSYDIVDTALAMQMDEGLFILDRRLEKIEQSLMNLARENRDLVMVGRTHGQHAIPITLGLKMAVYLSEFHRHRQRLREVKRRVLVGKMSGAVGSGAALGEHSFEIERLVMDDLSLGAEEAATQIVQRDRLIELLSHLANISVTCEKISTEIRTLQRPEIGEIAEPFDRKKQVGSSTMSHKRNPITCENITGLARTARSFIIPAFENGVQWNERDLSNSSSERFIIPHTFILTDDILTKLDGVLSGLVVNRERIRENVSKAGDVIMAESVIMELVRKGMGRQDAHESTRKAAMDYYTGTPYADALMKLPEISERITREEMEEALRPENYTGVSGERVDRVIEMVKGP